jgi:hypothetical protein
MKTHLLFSVCSLHKTDITFKSCVFFIRLNKLMSDEICDRAGLLGQDALFSLELDNWLNFVTFSIESLRLNPYAIL